MKSLRRSLAAFAALCLLSAAAFAADASGNWTWTQPARGGQGEPRVSTLTLAAKDGQLTGKLTAPGRGGDPVATEISNAMVKDDTVSFSVEREFNGNKMVSKYSGKLAGDTITGEVEAPGRDGATAKREWVAKRAK